MQPAGHGCRAASQAQGYFRQGQFVGNSTWEAAADRYANEVEVPIQLGWDGSEWISSVAPYLFQVEV